MMVLDASSVIELILQTAKAQSIALRALSSSESLHAPHLVDLEVAQVLRRLVQTGDISAARADTALEDFGALAIERHSHRMLLPRVWELRQSLSAYDASYVALAEALAVPLLTCDGTLARSHGHSAAIVTI